MAGGESHVQVGGRGCRPEKMVTKMLHRGAILYPMKNENYASLELGAGGSFSRQRPV